MIASDVLKMTLFKNLVFDFFFKVDVDIVGEEVLKNSFSS